MFAENVGVLCLEIPLIRIIWDREPPGYAENPDNGVFFENRLHWQFEVRLLLLTLRTVPVSRPFDNA